MDFEIRGAVYRPAVRGKGDFLMQRITMFYLESCPYCAQATQAIRELRSEDPEYARVELWYVEETRRPDVAAKFDYYYVPAMFIDGERIYEAKPGESYKTCKANVKRVFDRALGRIPVSGFEARRKAGNIGDDAVVGF